MKFLTLIILFLALTGPALAGDVLFINYNGSDGDIPTALAADSHTVTSVDVPPNTANTYFQGTDLGQYCAVVWSTAYAYREDLTGASNILSNWVTSGGHVLITSPDGIRDNGTSVSPLASLLGGAGATDNGGSFTSIGHQSNSVTTGLFDIRGFQPPDVIADMDALCGPLASGTIGLIMAQNTQCATNHQEPGFAWTLRDLGSGQTAYMASGNFTNTTTDEPNWINTTIPGEGVYNAGLRNFVNAACNALPPVVLPPATAIPTLSQLAIILLALLLMTVGLMRFSRH